MTLRLLPPVNDVANVPREFDADVLRPRPVRPVVVADAASRSVPVDAEGWYTPPAPEVDLAEEPASPVRPPAWTMVLAAASVVLGLWMGAPDAVAPLSPERVDAVVADGFAHLGRDDAAAAEAFRRALATAPAHPAALLGLGEATLVSEPAAAAAALCAAAEADGAVGASAAGLVEAHGLACR